MPFDMRRDLQAQGKPDGCPPTSKIPSRADKIKITAAYKLASGHRHHALHRQLSMQ